MIRKRERYKEIRAVTRIVLDLLVRPGAVAIGLVLCAMAQTSNLILITADLNALCPPLHSLAEESLINEDQAALVESAKRIQAEFREDAIQACEALRTDESLPHSLRRWATFMSIVTHGLPLEEGLAMADAWMDAYPEDYENTLYLRAHLAKQFAFSSGHTGEEDKRFIEQLMAPLLAGPRCTVSTIKAGMAYHELLQRCHIRIRNDRQPEIIGNTPAYSAERAEAIEALKRKHEAREWAILQQVDALLAGLEAAPDRITLFHYAPERVRAQLRQVRERLDSTMSVRSNRPNADALDH